MDHNVPTEDGPVTDPLAQAQLDALRQNCEEFGVPLYATGSGREGIVHVIGPELGLTQPGMTIVCGDSHTSTHGAFGALAFGIGTSEVEHVLATQTLPQRQAEDDARHASTASCRAGVTAKDMILGAIGQIGVAGGVGHVVEYAGAGDPQPLDGEPDDDLQHVDRGGRARRDDRARRHDVRLPRRPSGARRPAPTGSARSTTGARSPPMPDATFDRELSVDVAELAPQVTWGTNPEMVVPVTDDVPDPADYDDPDERDAAERALAYMGLEPGTAIAGHRGRPRLHRLVHERADRGPARRGGGRRRQARPPVACARWSSRARRRSSGRPRRRASTGSSPTPASSGAAPAARCASGMNPDILAARRALRLDLEPQLRGPAGRAAGGRISSARQLAAAAAIAGHFVDPRRAGDAA